MGLPLGAAYRSHRGRHDHVVHSKRHTPGPGADRHAAARRRPGGRRGQHRRPRRRAVRHRAAGRISRVDPRPATSRPLPAGCRSRSSASGGVTDVAFIGGTAYALVTVVGPDVGGNDWSASTGWTARTASPSSLTSARFVGNPPDPSSSSRPESSTRWNLPRRVPGHRRAPQPRGVALDGEITELIAFGNIVPTGLEVAATRSTWPRPAPSPTSRGRQGGGVPAKSPTLPPRSPPAPRSWSTWSSAAATPVRPLAGRLGRPSRVLRRCRTPAPGEGQRGRHLHRRPRRSGPADLVRVHREHRVRGHAHWGNMENREPPRVRHTARRTQQTTSKAPPRTP